MDLILLRHAGILRERDGGKEIVFMASLKKTVAHAGRTAWGAAVRVGKRESISKSGPWSVGVCACVGWIVGWITFAPGQI